MPEGGSWIVRWFARGGLLHVKFHKILCAEKWFWTQQTPCGSVCLQCYFLLSYSLSVSMPSGKFGLEAGWQQPAKQRIDWQGSGET